MAAEQPTYERLPKGVNFPRTPEQLRRNRRVALIAILIAVTIMLLSALYIATLGGVNKGPMQPYHSALGYERFCTGESV
jgi:hypothetical protein